MYSSKLYFLIVIAVDCVCLIQNSEIILPNVRDIYFENIWCKIMYDKWNSRYEIVDHSLIIPYRTPKFD